MIVIWLHLLTRVQVQVKQEQEMQEGEEGEEQEEVEEEAEGDHEAWLHC